jgi:hypothetical protein
MQQAIQGRGLTGTLAGSFCDGEMDNFQDPQLASHKPLNMDELFAP